MRYIKVEAIVLKRKNVGEADRLLTIFTREYGKMQIKAVGVRKIASKRASHIELLNKVSCTLYKGKGMPILTEVQSTKQFAKIKEDLQKVGFAYHLCELIESLCPENQENARIFDLFEHVLEGLTRTHNIVSLLHAFEIQLLTLLGYYPAYEESRNLNTVFLIENILERKLKARQLLPQLQ